MNAYLHKSIQEEDIMHIKWLSDINYNYYFEVKTKVKDLCNPKNATQPLPYFTPHGEKHMEAVEENIYLLLNKPEEQQNDLTEREKLFLLLASWVHDIGMFPDIVREVFPNHDYEANQIRKMHNITAEKYILSYWYKLGIHEDDRWVLAILCRFHRRQESLELCEKVAIINKEVVRLRLLAAYLRLADALDIGHSRAPAELYSLCLAYDIPPDIKLHWIKSRLITGILITPKDKSITVSFIAPRSNDDLDDDHEDKEFSHKFEAIKKIVLDDLRDELQSVIPVISREGPCKYLDIKATQITIGRDERIINDIFGVVLNYDIIMNPSASKLIEMAIISIIHTIGFSLDRKGQLHKFPSINISPQNSDAKEKVLQLLDVLKDIPLKFKRCHLGLEKLITYFKAFVNEQNDDCSAEIIAERAKELFNEHRKHKRQIREEARKCLKRRFPDFIKGEMNIILYGYSELVTKTLCGFRDVYLSDNGYLTPAKVYNSEIEADYSSHINIFICEGQPKTQTGYGDHMIYHDGSQYAFYLRQRNFTNICIIPDAIAGNLIETLPIHFILVGANGFDKIGFWHSAGHRTLVNLVKENSKRKNKNVLNTKIILVVSGEKYNAKTNRVMPPPISKINPTHDDWSKKRPSLIDGCRSFDLPYIDTRKSMWMLKDTELLKKLRVLGINFYNPLEEYIPYNYVDFIIAEHGHCDVKNENITNFLSKIQGYNEIKNSP
jgi:translation initiation factor 2B subunit (eIF-2B alpha/beta/delta family)